GFNRFIFYFKGQAGNSRDDIYFELRDGFGGTLGKVDIPNATTNTAWTAAVIDISGYGNASNSTSLANVRAIVLGVDGGTDFGVGTVYFDNVGGVGGTIPTLSEWGMIFLVVALVLLGVRKLAPAAAPMPVAVALALISLAWPCSRARAQIIESFESYADTAALTGAWKQADNMTVSLEASDAHHGAQSMSCEYLNNTGPFVSSVLYTNTTVLEWTGKTHFVVWVRGHPTNSFENLKCQVQDEFGGTIGEASLPGGTTNGAWTEWSMNLGDFTNSLGLAHVGRFKIIVEPNSFGTGRVLFDFAKAWDPLQLLNTWRAGTNVKFSWSTPDFAFEPTVAYQMWVSTNLASGVFSNEPASAVIASGSVTTGSLPIVADGQVRLFKVNRF
ncbi:MAG TPA: IPTL-CTERM sorting domain-containing protein, partial [Kiritimatiellia bacterium]